MSTLTIRFAGICCFLDPRPNSQDAFKKRVVLPIDKHVSERTDTPHIPYIEMDLLDNPVLAGRFAATKTYSRQGVVYRRVHLSGDRIRITNAVPKASGLNVLSTYTERIPATSKVTQGRLSYPDAPYLATPPPAATVAAYFDINYGDLHAGPSALTPTSFSAPTDWPLRRLATWVELQLEIEPNENPVIEVESFNPGGPGRRTIEIGKIADHITIGNQLIRDIEPAPGDSAIRVEDFREHYKLVYDLFSADTSQESRPENSMGIPNGCVGSNIP